ncbi:hypothetical protein [Clostridium sp. C105KSO13]|uniref:hypothetical protein n=1 Tax=Clostridium sp. C105KSO13 TaxID=1776045 RepID=UPI00074076BC|nr:hypothetical protein [Clostridium sp. C105KSO13]CUX42410.1 hypothetical protein BN3456_02240 [Clostridium sp. C105KSO13]
MQGTKSTTPFDDDFEVTYEEEVPFTYSFDTKPVTKDLSDETIVMDTPLQNPADNYASDDYNSDVYDSDDKYDWDGDDEDSYGANRYPSDDYDGEECSYGPRGSRNDYSNSSRQMSRRRKSASRIPNLLSPAKKTAKYGTKAIYRVARSVVRIVSFLITAGTLYVLASNFWRGAAPYGDPLTILEEKNYTLAGYAAVAAVFLVFEFIALLWSLTKVKVRDGRKIYRQDTGRGLFSYIFLYVASYVSFLLCSFLPESFESFEILNGVRGGLDVFGSMHNTLLGLCIAGVAACIVRKHMD